MRIAFFTEAFLPKYDGVVTAILTLSKYLVDNGHQLIIFAPKPRKNLRINRPEELKSVKVVLLPSTRLDFYPDLSLASPNIPKVINDLRKFNVDLIHFHGPGPVGASGIVAAKILNKPLVGTFHSYVMEYLKYIKLEKSKSAYQLVWKLSNFLHDRADLVICPSRYAARDLRRQGVKTKVVAIPNGIDPVKTVPVDIKQIKEKYGLAKYNILYVGRVSLDKNLEVLIESLPLIKQQIPDFKFNVIGDGPAMTDLLKLAIKLKISQNVNFLGAFKHSELMESGIYQACDVFVTSSTTETQCISAIEAMMFGMSLVLAHSKGLEELIRGNGLTVWPINKVKFAESIIRILKNEAWRKKLGEQSKRNVVNYFIDKTGKRTVDEYQRLLKPSKPSFLQRIFNIGN